MPMPVSVTPIVTPLGVRCDETVTEPSVVVSRSGQGVVRPAR